MPRLSMIGVEFGSAVLVLHHPTKAASSSGEKFNSWDPYAYFRGASAIIGAAGVLTGMWAPGASPAHRVMTVWSNTGKRRRWWYEVTHPGERSSEGMIDYWRPVDPPDSAGEDQEAMEEKLATIFEEDAEVTRNTAALRLTGKSRGSPSGAANKNARKVLDWAMSAEQGLVEEHERKHRLTEARIGVVRALRQVEQAVVEWNLPLAKRLCSLRRYGKSVRSAYRNLRGTWRMASSTRESASSSRPLPMRSHPAPIPAVDRVRPPGQEPRAADHALVLDHDPLDLAFADGHEGAAYSKRIAVASCAPLV